MFFMQDVLKGYLEIRADEYLSSQGLVRSSVKKAIGSKYSLKPNLLFYYTVELGKKKNHQTQ